MEMKRYLKLVVSTLAVTGLLAACSDDHIGQPAIDKKAPSPVTNVRVVSTAGGADIYYTLPDETDISYVLCEYTRAGEKKRTHSSIYNDHVSIEGLLDETPTTFTIYLVDHSENKSEGFTSSFIPLEAPISAVFKSISMEPDFGGAAISWENPSRAVIGAFLMAKNDAGEWVDYDLVFSTTAHATQNIRGYNDYEREFGVQLTDKFGNYSDTCVFSVKPLYEKLLDKTKFSNAHLNGDNNTYNGSDRQIENIWDGDMGFNDNRHIWHTDQTAGFTNPQYFTVDLGVEANLSRLVLWNRSGQYYYAQYNIRYFEVWGAKELSHNWSDTYWSDGSWKNEWTKLGDFEVVKPSGGSEVTDEDKAFADAGFNFDFPRGVGDIRYLRFVVKETWNKGAALHIAEISVYGDDHSN